MTCFVSPACSHNMHIAPSAPDSVRLVVAAVVVVVVVVAAEVVVVAVDMRVVSVAKVLAVTAKTHHQPWLTPQHPRHPRHTTHTGSGPRPMPANTGMLRECSNRMSLVTCLINCAVDDAMMQHTQGGEHGYSAPSSSAVRHSPEPAV